MAEEPPPVEGAGRMYLRDPQTFAIVDDLDQLRGPAVGTVALTAPPLWSHDTPQFISLDEPGGVEMVYQRVLTEGSVADLCRVLHRHRLIVVWPTLNLPGPVRALWESRFPQLWSTRDASRDDLGG